MVRTATARKNALRAEFVVALNKNASFVGRFCLAGDLFERDHGGDRRNAAAGYDEKHVPAGRGLIGIAG